jgi:hypothetical protein
MQNFDRAMRTIHFTLIVVFATLFGTAAGFLSWLDSQRVPASLLYGAGTFAAVVALGMAVVQFLRENR